MKDLERISKMFDEEGYCIVKNVIQKEKISNLFENVLNVYFKINTLSNFDNSKNSWNTDSLHKEMIEFRQKNPNLFSELYDSCQTSSALSKLVLDERILDISSNLLKCKKTELSHTGNMIRMDIPNDTRNRTTWHQEIAYVRNPGLVLWVPLVEITKEIGPLKILEKSHMEGEVIIERNKLNQYTTSRVSESEIPETILGKYKEKSVKIDLGDALFFDNTLMHSSGINTSTKIRFSCQTRFFNVLSSGFAAFRTNEVYNPHAMERLDRKNYD